ncbi:hypothetical protein KKE60_05120 [Patescibacteria group bacterium]|nr:hypothetical protein [Patescibacteria group bacterium]
MSSPRERSCYNCRHSYVASGTPDFIGDAPGEINDGTTCWYECKRGHEITDGRACDEWEQKDETDTC